MSPAARMALFLALNDRRHPNGPGWRPGGRVSLALGLGGPQTQLLWPQAPWEGHLGVRPRVRVSPQEASRHQLMAVGRAEGRDKVRGLGRASVGLRVLAWRAFEYHRRLGGP